MISSEHGKKLVAFARKAIEYNFSGVSFEIDDYGEKMGVFVTLHKHPSHDLRGCIGFAEPVMDLHKALVLAARSAAFSDPRFMPLGKDEFGNVVVEVSVLTKPGLIEGDFLKEVQIGRDGLIVEKGGRSGLLLPIVAVEQGWDAEEFLENACVKAGLDKDDWKEDCKISKFSSQVFCESRPGGEVVEKKF